MSSETDVENGNVTTLEMIRYIAALLERIVENNFGEQEVIRIKSRIWK